MGEYEFLQFPAEAVQIDPAIYDPLPASARKVFEAVRENGPLTHSQLGSITGLPARTIRYAVKRLKDRGILDSRCSLRDCRTCYFFINRRHIRADALEEARKRAEEAVKSGRLVERVRDGPRRPAGPQSTHGRPAAVPREATDAPDEAFARAPDAA